MRMKVTMEMLEKYDSSLEWKRFLKANFPDGAEALEIMNHSDITPEMLHFAARFFPLTKKELQRYQEICNVKNSKHCFSSEKVTNCIVVAESKYISDSEYVRESTNVKKSENIYGSCAIESSKDVRNSVMVEYSNTVVESNGVWHSARVCRSTSVLWSHDILDSSSIQESSYIYRSDNLNDCWFGGFMENCKHCLFCSDIEDKEFYIFNKQVSEEEFEKVKEDLIFNLMAENSEFIRINNEEHDPAQRFIINGRFDGVFEGLGPDFYGWISTIPQFDESVFFQLFLSDENLKFGEN